MGVDLHCHMRRGSTTVRHVHTSSLHAKEPEIVTPLRYTSREKNLTDMRSPLHAYLLYGSSNDRIREMGVLLRATSLWPIYSRATPTYNILVVKMY